MQNIQYLFNRFLRNLARWLTIGRQWILRVGVRHQCPLSCCLQQYYCIKGALALFVFSFFFWLRVLDKAEYSAFESTLNSPIVSYRIVMTIFVKYFGRTLAKVLERLNLSEQQLSSYKTDSWYSAVRGRYTGLKHNGQSATQCLLLLLSERNVIWSIKLAFLRTRLIRAPVCRYGQWLAMQAAAAAAAGRRRRYRCCCACRRPC